MAESGIYVIRNRVTGGFYLGSAFDLNRRRKQHFSYLRCGKHGNRHLQSSFTKHGEGQFEFVEVAHLEKQVLREVESRLLEALWRHPLCYNLSPHGAGGMAPGTLSREQIETAAAKRRGRKFSPEIRARMSAAQRARTDHWPPEARANLSAALRGRVFSEEHKARIGNAHRGKKTRPRTPEERQRYSEAQKKIGHRPPPDAYEKSKAYYAAHPELRERIAASLRGRKHPPEFGRKVSEAKRGKPVSASTLAAAIAANTGRKATAEHCAKISAALTGKAKSESHVAAIREAAAKRRGKKLRPLTPEHRAKISAAHKARRAVS